MFRSPCLQGKKLTWTLGIEDRQHRRANEGRCTQTCFTERRSPYIPNVIAETVGWKKEQRKEGYKQHPTQKKWYKTKSKTPMMQKVEEKASPVTKKHAVPHREWRKKPRPSSDDREERRGTFNIQQALITSVPNSFPFPQTGLSQPSIHKCSCHLIRSCARSLVTAAAVVQGFVSPLECVSVVVYGVIIVS